ncbi:hypothetical protein B484DRAFT_458826 [Ochromonadaceae sp. CCMP2298]|nr:hypothetical protein B484DRAFT_458826 [Ochromonadaceae sp. CCMP2298]
MPDLISRFACFSTLSALGAFCLSPLPPCLKSFWRSIAAFSYTSLLLTTSSRFFLFSAASSVFAFSASLSPSSSTGGGRRW